MSLAIHTSLDYWSDKPTDVLLQIEAAAIPEQVIEAAHIDITPTEHFARIASYDMIGERIWVREGQLLVDYRATISIERMRDDCLNLPLVVPHQLPGETVQYLWASRYCPSDQFETFVETEFAGIGRDAADVAFLTAFGNAVMNNQAVQVAAA